MDSLSRTSVPHAERGEAPCGCHHGYNFKVLPNCPLCAGLSRGNAVAHSRQSPEAAALLGGRASLGVKTGGRDESQLCPQGPTKGRASCPLAVGLSPDWCRIHRARWVPTPTAECWLPVAANKRWSFSYNKFHSLKELSRVPFLADGHSRSTFPGS